MSATAGNLDKALEVVHKTYHLQTTNNNTEHSSHNRHSVTRVSNHQPSRKTSVHDVQEAIREDLSKTVEEIHEGLGRLNGILETMTAAVSVRDEFGKIRLQLVVKITEFIHRLTNDSGRRSSHGSKATSTTLTYNPQQFAFCIEYFRNQLLKAQYLFSSLTLSASIGSSTLENVVVKSLSATNLQHTSADSPNVENNEDIIDIKKDLVSLDDHVHLLNQRYATEIPGWQTLEAVETGTGTTTMAMTGGEKLSAGDAGLIVQRLGVNPATQKLSATSSTTSIERSNFCARLYQKCQMVCCFCAPNYL